MFNVSLKNDALAIHQNAVDRYNVSHKGMMEKSSELYNVRTESVLLVERIENFINTIANTPKDFEKKMGLVKEEIQRFRETESYAKEALESEMKSGVGIVAGVAAGGTFAGMAPTVAMQIATTFGRASTGTAIKALSGAAAQKAALAWLGGGALSAGGAGVAGGKALLALAGPIGWSLTAVSVGVSLGVLSKKNKKISEDAINEAKSIMEARENLEEIIKKIEDLHNRTVMLMKEQQEKFMSIEYLRNGDYSMFNDEEVDALGALVNNTYSACALLNQTVGEE